MDIVYRFDPNAPIEVQQPSTNKAALKVLASGNDRFASLVEHLQAIGTGEQSHAPLIIPVNPVKLGIPIVSGLEPAHAPFAMVMGCSDARVPIEHVLDCSANDLFVVRVAGNVLGLECLGSIDYAVTHLSNTIRSVVVMGHTGCGAVTAAVDIYLSPSNFADIAFSHAVRSLLDRIMLSVRGAARALESAYGSQVHRDEHYRDKLIATSIYLNAAVTAYDLQREVNSIVKGLVVSYTVYDMAWTRIGALPIVSKANAVNVPKFFPSLKSPQEFISLASQIIEALA